MGAPDLRAHTRDGASAQLYLRSKPIYGADPFGLFDLSLVGLLAASTTASQIQSDMSQSVLETGVDAMFAAREFFLGIAVDAELDMEWASDWSQRDDAFSRSFSAGLADGVSQSVFEAIEPTQTQGDKQHVMGARWGDLHHLIPKFLGGAAEGALKRLPRAVHRKFHKRLDRRLSQALGISRSTGTAEMRKLFRSNPAMTARAHRILREVTEEFEEFAPGLTKAFEEALRKPGAWVF